MARRLAPAIPILLVLFSPASAEEGMWTFDAFPSGRVEAAYGFSPSPEWLERVRLATGRLSVGCSAGFVSPDGLLVTNYHCAEDCVADLSTGSRRLEETGFLARDRAREAACPGLELDRLVEIRDVTDRIESATKGLDGEARSDAMREIGARLEKECATDADRFCELVPLYHGGLYHLYAYRRFRDLRLVFAPERGAAYFGGDLDNFNFPRWDLDLAILRAYDRGAPASTSPYFRWSPRGPEEGSLVFVSGNPGETARLRTVAELEVERDVAIPWRLDEAAEMRGLLNAFARRGARESRAMAGLLGGIENELKVLRGSARTLRDRRVMDAKAAEEGDLRRRVAADPDLASRYGSAWDDVAALMPEYAALWVRYRLVEEQAGFRSALFSRALALVRAAEERPKPDGERLEEYTDARFPEIEGALRAKFAVNVSLEVELLEFSLRRLREELGPDDPFVKRVLGGRTPREVAETSARGTRLGAASARRKLLDGGKSAIEASRDPMIDLARRVDGEGRAVRARFADEIGARIDAAHERIAKARFAVLGTAVYPDATFTPRLSYGAVRGWVEGGKPVPAFTTFRGLFERYTGREPFDLPRRWLESRERLDPATPFNFVTTNDITGGSSGSPVVDREARLVGVAFDGNLPSIGGDFAYDAETNRMVAIDAGAILEALDRVYGATVLLEEIGKAAAAGAAEGGR